MKNNDAVVRFKEELFDELGITENPKRELLFSKAWELGHHAGFCEVKSYARDLVDLICADEDLLKAVFVIDALKKKNAELRECLESCMNAMCQFCREACPGVVCFHGCEYMKRAKKALESEDNHE